MTLQTEADGVGVLEKAADVAAVLVVVAAPSVD